jgi:hypothetical protein
LGAFAAFLVLSLAGEYIEQPGKVVAWAFMGIALTAGSRPDDPAVIQ